ncbi:MAG: acyltransferase domain-containing protein [Spirochaetes bacterium]|nr:acyltransferase domain-containing protein [Spirochaetota bacterium]
MPEQDNLLEDDIERIAIIGMAVRFPGANNIDEFWQNIRSGIESITNFSDDELRAYGVPEDWLSAPNFVKNGTILNDVDKFDAAFFGYSPREVIFMDPQHRLFIESAWEALENAGYMPENNNNSIGVFAGSGPNEYSSFLSDFNDNTNPAAQMEQLIGNERDFLSTRVSYKLNLKGPSMTVQTACSTSLIAVHLACQSLLSYQCSLSLAGAISINVTRSKGYFYQDGTIVSPDGHCRAFDAKANGTVGGQGVGIVVLKRLSEAIADGDHVYAVIRGSSINNDGGMKIGYTAPSVQGQAEVIAMAQAISDTPPDSIGYIEAHGTGTKLGDPIEIEALTQAFRIGTAKKQFCAIGSVKSNIGHADSAAGIAGLIKTALMLKYKEIPPSINYNEPNPSIDFNNSPFYVSTRLLEWKTDGAPRRAGVSSFGIGGTNAHAILEEAKPAIPSVISGPYRLMMISARSSQALNKACINLAEFIEKKPDINLADAAFTLQVGRRIFDHRRVILCRDSKEVITKLKGSDQNGVLSGNEPKSAPLVAFMFSGQGSQYAGMGSELYKKEGVFREHVDRCLDTLSSTHSIHLRNIIFPAKGIPDEAQKKIIRTDIAQASLFVLEYALAQLWISWGIKPKAMVGHSIGEYVAACLSGVFSLDTALSLVTARGTLMQQAMPGAMLAVSLPEAEVRDLTGDGLSLAAVNAPMSCVVSGDFLLIEAFEKRLEKQKTGFRRLHTSHAFHSAMMDPVLSMFRKEVSRHKFSPPQIPYLSNLTGDWITAEQATNHEYWVEHLRNTVMFSECAKKLLDNENMILLELGPGNTLCSLAMQQSAKAAGSRIFYSVRRHDEKRSDEEFILTVLGRLWLLGINPDWHGFYKDEKRQRVPLPTYPFERERYWPDYKIYKENVDKQKIMPVQMISDLMATNDEKNTISKNKNEEILYPSKIEDKVLAIWQELLQIKNIKPDSNFFELGGNSLIGANLIVMINRIFGIELTVDSIFYSPTVLQMAKLIEETKTGDRKQNNLNVKNTIGDAIKMLGLTD